MLPTTHPSTGILSKKLQNSDNPIITTLCDARKYGSRTKSLIFATLLVQFVLRRSTLNRLVRRRPALSELAKRRSTRDSHHDTLLVNGNRAARVKRVINARHHRGKHIHATMAAYPGIGTAVVIEVTGILPCCIMNSVSAAEGNPVVNP